MQRQTSNPYKPYNKDPQHLEIIDNINKIHDDIKEDIYKIKCMIKQILRALSIDNDSDDNELVNVIGPARPYLTVDPFDCAASSVGRTNV